MKPAAIALMSLLSLPAELLAWTGSPVRVESVTTGPAMVAVAHDGEYGALIAWQSAGAMGELRVTHLLGDGSADPSWPVGGLALAAGVNARSGLTAISDEHGGAYLHWQEGSMLYLTRVLASGGVAPGWPARGRSLGSLTSSRHRPWVELDEEGGAYVGWFQGARTELLTPQIRVIHLSKDNLGAGGWPNAARALPLDTAHEEWVASASFAVAEDGGVWVLVGTGRTESGVQLPGEWRLGRFLANGALDPVRAAHGSVLEAFDAMPLEGFVPRISLGAVVADGEGGVTTAIGTVAPVGPGEWSASARLERRLSDGSLHPLQGTPSQTGSWYETLSGSGYVSSYEVAAYSLRLVRDGAAGLVLASTQSYTHIGNVLELKRIDAFGASLGGLGSASDVAPSFQRTAGTGYLFTLLDVDGPGPYNAEPSVRLRWSSGASVQLDSDFSPYAAVFADMAAAPLPDDGAIAVWSRLTGDAGLYAQRVGANGSVLGAPPAPATTRALQMSRSGHGVLARWSAGAAGTLRLLDLQGRELLRHEVGEEAGEATLRLPHAAPGIVFGQLLRRDGSRSDARVVVLR